ncbi:MAG: hemin uptake protein HemP [Planctomycetia bacterium]|nr:hemin uptake protein HemP [Planctomycetia bacterium]
MSETDHPSPAAPLPSREDRISIRVLHSADLLGGQREVCIEHAGQIYRLRVTKSGKLILQK